MFKNPDGIKISLWITMGVIHTFFRVGGDNILESVGIIVHSHRRGGAE